MNILIVEDEKPLLEGIVSLLEEEGYIVESSLNGKEGLLLAKQNIFDAIILDVMLPEIDGFSLLKSLRGDSIQTPVLFLTAKDSIEDRVKGLDYGANDYLIKPFATPELLARLRVLLRQRNIDEEGFLSYGPLKINPINHTGYAGEHLLSLTVKEFQLLEYLLRNKEQILIRDQIFNRIWGFSSDAGVGVVDVFVHHLRKKLSKYQCEHYIKTVRGIGFMLQGDPENVPKN
ncbi:response regulator transcription factor [Bacillus sp. 03113]|uniref:response regulator transcription factor n=1 Tax=Bacillus sp. 03113 TaxID=2578211 RepID=UPI001141B115|nr:response regulator transcription factor [Bacillus sp. 03113]